MRGHSAWVAAALAVLASSSACDAVRGWLDEARDPSRPEIPAPESATAPAQPPPTEPDTAASPSDDDLDDDAGAVARMVASMEAAKPKLPAYGVVRDGARMFIDPDREGGHFVAGNDNAPPPPRYGYYGGPPPADPDPTGRAVRIVGVAGDMFEIETMTADDAELTCAGLQPELSSVRARLWVERESLVPVLDHPVTVELDEHSTITLAPGVPAFETDEEGKFRVYAAGIQLEVALPQTPPARWHAAAAPMDTEGAVGTFPAWYTMTFAGDNFPPDGPTGRQQGQLYGDINGNTWVFADDVVDGQSRVRVKNRCLDAQGIVVTDPRNGKPTEPVPASARRRPQTMPPQILAGTMLRWDNGAPAGVATAPIAFGGTARASDQDTCFEISKEVGSPQLCVATSELEASPAKQGEDEKILMTASTSWNAATPVEVALVDQMWEHAGPMRDCFRARVRPRPGHNYASANLNLKVDSAGKVAVNWGSAWTSRGSSTALQTCLEDVAKTFAVPSPPPADANVSLNLSVTRR